jgi:hypothetical protein
VIFCNLITVFGDGLTHFFVLGVFPYGLSVVFARKDTMCQITSGWCPKNGYPPSYLFAFL